MQPARADPLYVPSHRPTPRHSHRPSRSWTTCERGRSTRTSSRGSCCPSVWAAARAPSTPNWKRRLSCLEIRRPSMQIFCALHERWPLTSIRLVCVKHRLHFMLLLMSYYSLDYSVALWGGDNILQLEELWKLTLATTVCKSLFDRVYRCPSRRNPSNLSCSLNSPQLYWVVHLATGYATQYN